MYFHSDNCSGAHPQINEFLTKFSDGFHIPYGEGELDQRVKKLFNELFEREVEVIFAPTGTATNCLALTACEKPAGVIFCPHDAHINKAEGNAPHFFTKQKIQPIPTINGKISADDLEYHIKQYLPLNPITGIASTFSFSQTNDVGRVYNINEIQALCDVAHKYDLTTHMDGARFVNAMLSLNSSPAAMTWQSGVDLLSFGASKNGCWCAEALVIMNPEKFPFAKFLQKQTGACFSKSRFVSAQFLGYFHNDLWLKLAAHSNNMAQILLKELAKIYSKAPLFPVEANEIFLGLEVETAQKLHAANANFLFTPYNNTTDTVPKGVARFVTSYSTEIEHINKFVELFKTLSLKLPS